MNSIPMDYGNGTDSHPVKDNKINILISKDMSGATDESRIILMAKVNIIVYIKRIKNIINI